MTKISWYKKEFQRRMKMNPKLDDIVWAFAKVRGEVHVFQFPKELRTTNKSVCGRVEIGNQKLIRGGVSDENARRLLKSCCRKCYKNNCNTLIWVDYFWQLGTYKTVYGRHEK